MSIALGYIVEDCVFALWTFSLIVALIRNLWFERKYMEDSSKGHIIRNTNRASVVFFLSVLVLAPDFRAIRGLYSNDSILFSLVYAYMAIALFFTSCSFIYFTLQSASVATARTLNTQITMLSQKTSHVVYSILPVIAVAVATPACVLSNLYATDFYIAIWHIMLAFCVTTEIFIYMWLSIKLQRALMDLGAGAQHTWYLQLHRRLRVYQVVLTIPAALLVVGLLYFVPANINTTRRTTRFEDQYNFSWAVWMWFGLALESGFMYVAWVSPNPQLAASRASEVLTNRRASKLTLASPSSQNVPSQTSQSRGSLRLEGFSIPSTAPLVNNQESSSNNAIESYELAAVPRSSSDEPISTGHSHVAVLVQPASPTTRSERVEDA